MTSGTTVQHAAAQPRSAGAGGFIPAQPASRYDDIVRLACQLGGAPIALLAFDSGDGLRLAASAGLAADDPDIALPFCAAAMRADGPLETTDPSRDPRFAHDRLLAFEPALRACAAVALESGAGGRIGTLCVLDRHWRPFDTAQCDGLAALARMAVAVVQAGGEGGIAAMSGPAAARGVAEPYAGWPAAAINDDRYAVAILELDAASVAAPVAVMQQVQDLAAAVIGHDDVLSRDGPAELLLVLARAAQAASTLERLSSAIDRLPAQPRVAVGAATGRYDQDAMEDVFLAAEAAMQQVRGQGGCRVAFAAASRPVMNA